MIRSLRVTGFRSLTDARLTPGPGLTLVLGPNGAGKSSLAAAIEYALTGACGWTDRGGRGAADLIAHDAGEATVDLDLATDPKVAIMRTISPKGARVGVNEHSGQKAEAQLELRLPSVPLMRCILRSDEFVSLPIKEQQDLLFALSGAEPDVAWVRSHLAEQEAEVLDRALSVTLTGSALLKHLDAEARDLRKSANAELKGAQAALGQTPQPTISGGRTAANIRAELENLRKGMAELQKRVGAADEQRKAREKALQREADARVAVARAQDVVASLGEQPATDPEGFERLATERANITRETTKLIEDRAAAKGEASALQRQVEGFAALEGHCPLGTVSCPLSEEQRTAAIADAVARIEHLGELSAELDDRIALHQSEGAKLDEALQKAQDAAHSAVDWGRKRDGYAKVLQDAEAALERAAKETAETTALDDEDMPDLAADEQREQRLEAQLREAEALERHAKLAASLEPLEARAALLDALVKKLAPDGLPQQAMAETVGLVLEAVNERLAEFTDFVLAFGPDGELGVVRTSDGTGVVTQVAHLSESERLRVGAAIQVAFAQLTGFGLVVVDAADRLDTANRGPLLVMLLNSGVQALVLATPLNGKRPSAEGLECYDLVEGRLVACEAHAAEVAA